MKTCFSYFGWINAFQLSIHEEMWKAISRPLRVCFRLRQTRNPVSGKRAVTLTCAYKHHPESSKCLHNAFYIWYTLNKIFNLKFISIDTIAKSDLFPLSTQSCASENTSSQIFVKSKHLWNIFKTQDFQN